MTEPLTSESEPVPPPKHRRSKIAVVDSVNKYEYDPHRRERRNPSPPPPHLPDRQRPTSRSHSRHRQRQTHPSARARHSPLKRPHKPRPPSPGFQPFPSKPPSVSTTRSPLTVARGAKLTPSEHSAYSLQHNHSFNPPRRRSFEQPFVQVSPTPPMSTNPSANPSGEASLAQLSARRAISGVEMDTTGAAWHPATVRPTRVARPYVRLATVEEASAQAPVVTLPSVTSRNQQPRHPPSLTSFEVPPPEALSSIRSSYSTSLHGPAFLSQVRREAMRPSSTRLIPGKTRIPSGLPHLRQGTFGNAVEYCSPSRTVATSAGRSRVLPPSTSVRSGDQGPAFTFGQGKVGAWTRMFNWAAEVDEFGHTRFGIDGLSASGDEFEDDGGRDESGGSVGLSPDVAADSAQDEHGDLILPWQASGRLPAGAVARTARTEQGDLGGVPAPGHTPPTLSESNAVVESSGRDGYTGTVMGDATDFMAGKAGADTSQAASSGRERFAREMRGWWHKSRP